MCSPGAKEPDPPVWSPGAKEAWEVRLSAVKGLDERPRLERETERVDRESGELVYELYGLREEERRVGEEAVAR